MGIAATLAVREAGPAGVPKPRLLDRVRAAIRARHYSRRTEKTYVAWIRRYIFFHCKRHPAEMGAAEVTRFLTSLAVAQRLPVVLTRAEVRAIIQQLEGAPRLMAVLMYGAGLRLLECARLRLQDIDFASNQIVVRGGKGDKDRVTMLPAAVKADLARYLERVKRQHERDLQSGAGWVELPWALARKYPNAGREWVWQWVFPATRLYVDRVTGQRRRHHLHESVLQRAVEGGRAPRGHREAGDLPHVSALLCHPPAGGQPRHPHRPGAPRSP